MKKSVVVVTGAGRGIGRAIAQRFASAGAHVVAAARSSHDLNETKEAIERAGGTCDVQATDVCIPDEISVLIESTVRRHGRIDGLINNAGVAPHAMIEQLDPSTFEAMNCVNIDAIYHACRMVWPVMKRQGGGVIVSTSSIASVDAFPGFAAYGASKAWVNAWTKGLAEEGRPLNIRVFAVAPGAVETRMLRDVFPTYPKDQTLEPSDVADAVYALTQPDCRHATGQTVFVRR